MTAQLGLGDGGNPEQGNALRPLKLIVALPPVEEVTPEGDVVVPPHATQAPIEHAVRTAIAAECLTTNLQLRPNASLRNNTLLGNGCLLNWFGCCCATCWRLPRRARRACTTVFSVLASSCQHQLMVRGVARKRMVERCFDDVCEVADERADDLVRGNRRRPGAARLLVGQRIT